MLAALGLVPLAVTIGAQELEPGVQTSSAAAPVQRSQSPTAIPPQGPKQNPPPSPAGNRTAPAAAAASATTANAAPAGAAAGKGRSSDRIQLDTTQISGNRELPKVMYVVPWRRADAGDFSGRPPNSLLDEALTPVDRDVFKRQNSYYGVVQERAQSPRSQAGVTGAAADPSTPKDEK
jgi:hypothetical protein